MKIRWTQPCVLSVLIMGWYLFLGFPSVGWSAESGAGFAEIEAQLEQMHQRIENMRLRVDGLEHHNQNGVMIGVEDQFSKEQYEELSERLEAQEDLSQELDEKVGSRAIVHAFDAMQLDFGGFLHSAFTHIHGDQGSASSFDRLTFELLLKAQFSRRFSAFFAQAFIRESNSRFTDTYQRTSPGFTFSGAGV